MRFSARQREAIGVAAACVSASLGGTMVVATRGLIAGTDPATLGVLRFGIGTACLSALILSTGLRWPQARDLPAIALLGIVNFGLFPWLFNAALARTTAGRGAIALATLPFLTLVFSVVGRTERLTRWKLAGVACATGGVVLALSGQLEGAPEAAWRGDLIMVGAAACAALYNVLSQPYLDRNPAMSVTAVAMLAGSSTVTAVLLLAGVEPGFAGLAAFGAPHWLATAYLGVFGGAVTFFLWGFALEQSVPSRVATAVTLSPVVALGLGVLLLGEGWSPRLLLGLAAVLAGIALVNRKLATADAPQAGTEAAGEPARGA